MRTNERIDEFKVMARDIQEALPKLDNGYAKDYLQDRSDQLALIITSMQQELDRYIF